MQRFLYKEKRVKRAKQNEHYSEIDCLKRNSEKFDHLFQTVEMMTVKLSKLGITNITIPETHIFMKLNIKKWIFEKKRILKKIDEIKFLIKVKFCKEQGINTSKFENPDFLKMQKKEHMAYNIYDKMKNLKF